MNNKIAVVLFAIILFISFPLKSEKSIPIQYGKEYFNEDGYSFTLNSDNTGTFIVYGSGESEDEYEPLGSQKIARWERFDGDGNTIAIMREAAGTWVSQILKLLDENSLEDEDGNIYLIRIPKAKKENDSFKESKETSKSELNTKSKAENNDNDIIALRNGGTINAKILEITQTEIKYKKASNPNGPLYSISKNEIESIEYPNGDKDLFTLVETDDGTPKQRETKPARNNREIISLYNKEVPTRNNKEMNEKKDKYTDLGFVYWGITDNSVLSTDDVEVSIINSNLDGFNQHSGMYKFDYRYSYIIQVSNKSDKPVYLDLGNTFKVVNGRSYVWSNGTNVVETHNQNIGGAVNLGAVTSALGIGGALGTIANGLTVGGSNNKGISIDKSVPRFIAVAPHSTVTLPARQEIVDNKVQTIYEWLDATPSKKWKKDYKLRKWETRTYDETSAPFRFDYYITYSTDPNFKNYYVLPIHLYSRAIYGTNGGELLRTHSYNLKDTRHIIYGEFK